MWIQNFKMVLSHEKLFGALFKREVLSSLAILGRLLITMSSIRLTIWCFWVCPFRPPTWRYHSLHETSFQFTVIELFCLGSEESRMRLSWHCLLQLWSECASKTWLLNLFALQEQCFPLCTVPRRVLLLAFLTLSRHSAKDLFSWCGLSYWSG